MVPLKHLSTFWRTLEMSLINCEVDLILTWSSTCLITNSNSAGTFKIKPYVAVVTLSTQDKAKLLQQLKSGFNRTINWNKYLSKPEIFGEPIKENKVTCENIRKIATGQGDDYATGCFLDYPYFKDTYEITAVDLSKQKVFDANPIANQQINFAANLNKVNDTKIYFILEEAKETRLDFSQGTVKVL